MCSIRGRNLVIQSEQNRYSCYHVSVVRLNQNLSGSRVHGEILEIFYEWMEMVYTTRATKRGRGTLLKRGAQMT